MPPRKDRRAMGLIPYKNILQEVPIASIGRVEGDVATVFVNRLWLLQHRKGLALEESIDEINCSLQETSRCRLKPPSSELIARFAAAGARANQLTKNSKVAVKLLPKPTIDMKLSVELFDPMPCLSTCVPCRACSCKACKPDPTALQSQPVVTPVSPAQPVAQRSIMQLSMPARKAKRGSKPPAKSTINAWNRSLKKGFMGFVTAVDEHCSYEIKRIEFVDRLTNQRKLISIDRQEDATSVSITDGLLTLGDDDLDKLSADAHDFVAHHMLVGVGTGKRSVHHVLQAYTKLLRPEIKLSMKKLCSLQAIDVPIIAINEENAVGARQSLKERMSATIRLLREHQPELSGFESFRFKVLLAGKFMLYGFIVGSCYC